MRACVARVSYSLLAYSLLVGGFLYFQEALYSRGQPTSIILENTPKTHRAVARGVLQSARPAFIVHDRP